MSEEDIDEWTWDELENWQPSDHRCPECGSAVEIGRWWDDHPRMGGACIGTQRRCTNGACDYYEKF